MMMCVNLSAAPVVVSRPSSVLYTNFYSAMEFRFPNMRLSVARAGTVRTIGIIITVSCTHRQSSPSARVTVLLYPKNIHHSR